MHVVSEAAWDVASGVGASFGVDCLPGLLFVIFIVVRRRRWWWEGDDGVGEVLVDAVHPEGVIV